eukprot:SAG31_NODE_23144_length_510_cov_0.878345_2_plen_59_part_01
MREGDAPANGYVAVIDNAAPHFGVYGPKGPCECGAQVKAHISAKRYGCRYAVNAGSGWN